MKPADATMGGGADFSALESAASAGTPESGIFLERLDSLYVRMDRRYAELADQAGFHCRGCEESCCKTLFYHHTLMEYLYIRAGVLSLAKEKQAEILGRSREVSAKPDAGRFCPLNENGLCLVYSCRPMICRLHGLAHELRRPDGTVHRGPGCSAFEAVSIGKTPVALDRTEFYWALSRLEKEARTAFGFTRKIRMTVSQMMEAVLYSKFPKESPHHETC
jgi:Fe-S-cluster containining protein